MDKQAAWETLKQEAIERFGPGIVFGEGPLDARIAIVGEAAGEQETKMGRPFVGRAGRLLDQVLEAAKIDWSEIYVTNMVKVRPTTERDGRLKNHPPRVGRPGKGSRSSSPNSGSWPHPSSSCSGTYQRKPS